MRVLDRVQLAVERPVTGVVVIRVAGDLDRGSAVRVVRLLDQQCGFARTRTELRGAQVVVDLGDVRSFAEGALDMVCDAGTRITAAGLQLHVTGLAAREPVLPHRVADVIPRLATFPTLEAALDCLAAG